MAENSQNPENGDVTTLPENEAVNVVAEPVAVPTIVPAPTDVEVPVNNEDVSVDTSFVEVADLPHEYQIEFALESLEIAGLGGKVAHGEMEEGKGDSDLPEFLNSTHNPPPGEVFSPTLPPVPPLPTIQSEDTPASSPAMPASIEPLSFLPLQEELDRATVVPPVMPVDNFVEEDDTPTAIYPAIMTYYRKFIGSEHHKRYSAALAAYDKRRRMNVALQRSVIYDERPPSHWQYYRLFLEEVGVEVPDKDMEQLEKNDK